MYTGLQYSFVLCGYRSRRPGLRHNLLSSMPIDSTATWFEWTLNSFMRWLVNKNAALANCPRGDKRLRDQSPLFPRAKTDFLCVQHADCLSR